MRFFKSRDDLPSHLTRLMDMNPLSAAEEAALFRRVRAGDEAAKRLLVEANMRLVINVAKAYRGQALRLDLTLDDLIQAGSDGLTRATERFDPEKGYRFTTYATHWVRQAIGRAIDHRSGDPRPPTLMAELLRKVDETRARLFRDLEREPTLEELAAALGVEPRQLRAVLEARDDLDAD